MLSPALAASPGGSIACSGADTYDPGQDRKRECGMTRFIHTMLRIVEPEKTIAFYEALGFEFRRQMDIVRGGEREATNYFMGIPGHDEPELELTFNHDGRTYELGTAYGHIALLVDDLEATLARLAEQGIEPERPPYSVRDGGNLLTFVRDPVNGYRVELIGSQAA